MSESEDLSALEALTDEPPEDPPADPPPEDPPEPPKADPLEEKALSRGWRPKDDYDGDEHEWVDAGEFLRRAPLFDQLSKKDRKIRDLEKKLDGTAKFVEGIEKRVREQTLSEIEADRRKAVEDGDVEAFEAADKKYREAEKPVEPEPVDPDIPEEVQDFAKRNGSWFEKNAAMTEDSVSFTKFYRGQGKELGEALELAEKDIKRKYPDFFENPNKKRPQSVASDNKEKGATQRGYSDLTDEQKSVFAVIKSRVKLEDYIKELESQGAFK